MVPIHHLKRFLITAFVALIFSFAFATAEAAPAVVQTCAANTFGTSVTCTTGSNVTAGDVIHVVAYTQSGTTAPTISGTGSCNIIWNTLQSNAAQSYASAYGTVASTGACSIKMTTGDVAKNINVNAVEMSGVSAAIDGDTFSTTASNASSYTTPSITTASAGDMVIGSWIVNKSNSAGTVTVNAPFTCASSPSLCGSTGGVNGGIAYSVQGTPGAISATFNKSSSSVFGSFLETTAYLASAGGGNPSDTTAPSTPTGLGATVVSPTQINLSWTASTDPDNTASQISYSVYRNGTKIATTGTGVTSYSDTGLTASTNYSYTVSASDPAGNASVQTASVSATTQTPPTDTTAPSVPTGLSASSISSSQINLSWTASTDPDNTAGQITYNVYRNGTLVATTGAGVTSYSDIGLASLTNYSYTVSASDPAGNASAQSVSAYATTLSSGGGGGGSGTYLWSSILASSRAVDWSHAGAGGLDGALPSASWTQCGATIAPYGDAGIADISGSTLTWRAGTPFGSTSPSWVGGTIKVGGVSYTIASVNSPTSITLTSSSPIPLTGRGFVGPNLGNVSTINNQLNGCAPDTYVQLGTGFFGLNGGISDTAHNNVEVRGMGADKTQLIFSNLAGCLGAGAGICFDSSDLNYNAKVSNLANWTAGYAQGTTNITLDSTPNLKVGNPIILDQLDDSLASDSGAVFVCSAQGSCSISGNGNAPRTNRDQMQIVTVTSCNGVTTQGAACTGTNVSVGISPGLYMPNWRSSQQPQAWWATGPVLNVGVQNLSIDNSALGASSHGITFFNTLNGWVRGVRSIDGGYAHVFIELSARITVRDSYFYLTQNSVNSSYGISCFGASDNLYENNILQAVSGPVLIDSACSGSVIGYNYSINDFNSLGANWLNAFSNPHTAGVDTLLYEGNIGPQIYADNFHGTRNLLTIFRNYLWGTQPVCWGGSWVGGVQGSGFYYPEDVTSAPCNNTLAPVILRSYSRMFNVIGNVLGTPGVQRTYQSTYSNNDIYDLNYNDMTGGADLNTASTLMRWGNYDAVNNATRFLASEVPSNLTGAQAPFSNPVPANNSLPPSFYETSKPFWWPTSTPWPAIGPDVAGGNILQCTSGPYIRGYALSASQCGGGTSAPIGNGLAYAIPAMNCYLNVMGGTPDGTGHYLSFNADTCYGSATGGSVGGGDTTAPTTPSGLAATSVSASQINLSWSASTDPDNIASQIIYNVFRNGVLVATVGNGVTTYSDTGLAASTQYTYTVSASDLAGNTSAQATAVSATTQALAAPVISGLVSSNITTSSIKISWTTDQLSNTQVVYGLTASYGSASTLVDTNPMVTSHSVILTGLTPNTTYHFAAKSANAGGSLTTSPDFTFTTNSVVADTTPPSVPTGLTSSNVTTSTIALSWTASTDNVSVAGYKVFRNGVQIGTVTNPSYADSGLAANTTYSYAVAAYDPSNNVSAQSSPLVVTTQFQNTVPPSITITSPTANQTVSGSITVSGTAAANVVSLTSVQVSIDGGTYTSAQGTTSWTYALNTVGLANGNHTITIKATDSSNLSSTASVTINVQNAVTTLQLSSVATSSVTNNGATISWTTNLPANSVVKYGTAPASLSSNLTSSTLVTTHGLSLSNLQKNTTYYAQAVSTDNIGDVANASVISFTTLLKPPKVKNVSAAPGSILLAWTDPTNTDGSYASIEIVRRTDQFSSDPVADSQYVIATVSSTATSYDDANVSPATTYYYSIFTIDNTGTASDAATVVYTTPAASSGGSSGGGSSSGGGGGGGSTTYIPPLPSSSSSTPSTSSSTTSIYGFSGGMATSTVGVGNVTDLRALLAQLLAELKALIAQLNHQVVQSFTRNLTTGSNGTDVQNLQMFLNDNGYTIATTGSGSPGNESLVFGPKTAAALARYQKDNKLPPTGFLGPATRALMKSKY